MTAEWVKITDRLPDHEQSVIICLHDDVSLHIDKIHIATFYLNKSDDGSISNIPYIFRVKNFRCFYEDVTHWTAIPSLPK